MPGCGKRKFLTEARILKVQSTWPRAAPAQADPEPGNASQREIAQDQQAPGLRSEVRHEEHGPGCPATALPQPSRSRGLPRMAQCPPVLCSPCQPLCQPHTWRECSSCHSTVTWQCPLYPKATVGSLTCSKLQHRGLVVCALAFYVAPPRLEVTQPSLAGRLMTLHPSTSSSLGWGAWNAH